MKCPYCTCHQLLATHLSHYRPLRAFSSFHHVWLRDLYRDFVGLLGFLTFAGLFRLGSLHGHNLCTLTCAAALAALRRSAYSGAGLGNISRQCAFLIVDFKVIFPSIMCTLKWGSVISTSFSASGSSMFLYRLTSSPFTIKANQDRVPPFRCDFSCFHYHSCLFVLGLLPLWITAAHTPRVKNQSLFEKGIDNFTLSCI